MSFVMVLAAFILALKAFIDARRVRLQLGGLTQQFAMLDRRVAGLAEEFALLRGAPPPEAPPPEEVAPPPEIRPSAAAKLLGVNETTVRLWIRQGLLPARKTRPDGGHYRLRREDVEALRQRQQFKPDARVLKRQAQEDRQPPT